MSQGAEGTGEKKGRKEGRKEETTGRDEWKEAKRKEERKELCECRVFQFNLQCSLYIFTLEHQTFITFIMKR